MKRGILGNFEMFSGFFLFLFDWSVLSDVDGGELMDGDGDGLFLDGGEEHSKSVPETETQRSEE